MNSVLEILGGARRLVAAPDSGLRDAATATLLDGLMTTMLGHAAPEVERLTAAWRDTAPIHGATLLSIPSGMASPENAACANAVALCWFELDPGFRHAGCHVTLHTLPALLAAGEFRQSTIAQTLARFIFCYEVVARIAMNWDTRPSGLHSHAVFSNLGAVLAVCAAHDEDDVLMAHALDLASSALNCGQSWEVSEGGELRNLWPGLAAANAFTLYRAAKAGVTTTPGLVPKARGIGARIPLREARALGKLCQGPTGLSPPACGHRSGAATSRGGWRSCGRRHRVGRRQRACGSCRACRSWVAESDQRTVFAANLHRHRPVERPLRPKCFKHTAPRCERSASRRTCQGPEHPSRSLSS
jgi:hypothetical protein